MFATADCIIASFEKEQVKPTIRLLQCIYECVTRARESTSLVMQMRRRCVELMAKRNTSWHITSQKGSNIPSRLLIRRRGYWQSGDSCLPRSQQFPQHMCSAQWECRMRRRPARHYSRRPKNLFILPSSYAHVMGSKRYCVASCIVSIMSGEQLRLVRKDQHKNGRDMDQVEGVEGTGFT